MAKIAIAKQRNWDISIPLFNSPNESSSGILLLSILLSFLICHGVAFKCSINPL